MSNRTEHNFNKMKAKLLDASFDLTRRDHYAALRYFLIKTNTQQLFLPRQLEMRGYVGSHAFSPSHHPWLQNMRRLLAELGWEQLLQFLDFCALTRHNPAKCFVPQWIEYQKIVETRIKIQAAWEDKAVRKIKKKAALSYFGKYMRDRMLAAEAKLKLQNQEPSYPSNGFMSLSKFAKTFGIKPKVIKELKSFLKATRKVYELEGKKFACQWVIYEGVNKNGTKFSLRYPAYSVDKLLETLGSRYEQM